MPKLVILGTSTNVPDETHENSHMVLVGEDRMVLFDGPGNPYVRLRKAGLDEKKLTDVVMTHFHPDHVSGIPLLLMASGLSQREEHLDIYANAYRYRLIEALQETFPALHTLMGDEDFFGLGMLYLERYPSKHYSLRYFGHQLHQYLRQEQAYKQQEILAQMAEFEWLLRAAFDAADHNALTLESLHNIQAENWPGLNFVFHPSVQRIELSFNVPQL